MARPLRVEFEGAVYHVTSRGDRREPIFVDDVDRLTLLEIASEAFERFEASALAWCFMGNHYHFVICTRRANLSMLMRQINGVYTQRFNRRHSKVGHLFQGRFKAIFVDTDAYLLEVCRYVDLNPVRAALVEQPQHWAWSSFRALAGQAAAPTWLDVARVHAHLIGREASASGGSPGQRYAQFVAQGVGQALWDEGLRGQIFLGDEAFMERIQAKLLPATREDAQIPREQRTVPAASIAAIRSECKHRDEALALCVRHGHSLSAIAREFGLSVSRVSRLVAKGKT
jgi:putative transposase